MTYQKIIFQRGQDSGAPNTPPPAPENDLLTLRALESRLQVSIYNTGVAALVFWLGKKHNFFM